MINICIINARAFLFQLSGFVCDAHTCLTENPCCFILLRSTLCRPLLHLDLHPAAHSAQRSCPQYAPSKYRNYWHAQMAESLNQYCQSVRLSPFIWHCFIKMCLWSFDYGQSWGIILRTCLCSYIWALTLSLSSESISWKLLVLQWVLKEKNVL